MNADQQAQDPFGGAGGGFWGGRGPRGRPGQGPGQDGQAFDDFESFMNMGMGMGGVGRERPSKGQDIFLNIDLSFTEAVSGCKRQIKLEKKGVCQTCKGSKCKPGTAPSKCFTCGGRGMVHYKQGVMTIQMSCTQCRGTGATIKNPCGDCRGTGIQTVEQAEEINVPKGINNGQSLRMNGKVMKFIESCGNACIRVM